MKLSRSGRMDTIFGQALEKKAAALPPIDKRLDEKRKEEGKQHDAGTLELIIDEDRKKEDVKAQEAMIRDQEHLNAKNKDLTGTTEERLEKANKDNYPHRNEKAWERTKDKRPVNALEGEMGKASDEKKLDRWEKAQKKAQLDDLEQSLDGLEGDVTGDQLDMKDDAVRNKKMLKEVGTMSTSVKTLQDKEKNEQIQETFDQQQKQAGKPYNKARLAKEAAQKKIQDNLGGYLSYKGTKNPWSKNAREAKQLDAVMSGIMSKASVESRNLSDEEKSQIEALKKRKTEVLNIAWAKK